MLEHPECNFVQEQRRGSVLLQGAASPVYISSPTLKGQRGLCSKPVHCLSRLEQFLMPRNLLPSNLMLKPSFPACKGASVSCLLPNFPLCKSPHPLPQLRMSAQNPPAMCQRLGLPPTQSICCYRAQVLLVLMLGDKHALVPACNKSLASQDISGVVTLPQATSPKSLATVHGAEDFFPLHGAA